MIVKAAETYFSLKGHMHSQMLVQISKLGPCEPSSFIRPSKTGRIMGSPMVSGRAASSSLSGAYLQKYTT